MASEFGTSPVSRPEQQFGEGHERNYELPSSNGLDACRSQRIVLIEEHGHNAGIKKKDVLK